MFISVLIAAVYNERMLHVERNLAWKYNFDARDSRTFLSCSFFLIGIILLKFEHHQINVYYIFDVFCNFYMYFIFKYYFFYFNYYDLIYLYDFSLLSAFNILITSLFGNNVLQIYKKMMKSPSFDNTADDTLSDTNNMFAAKVKDLLNITKDRLKKKPHHPLHLQLKEELLDLKLDIDLNGTLNSRKYLFKLADSLNF